MDVSTQSRENLKKYLASVGTSASEMRADAVKETDDV
jgi:hypothetical protein